jgi:adenylosuccinate synthase
MNRAGSHSIHMNPSVYFYVEVLDMVKKLRADKVNGIVTLEITKNDLRNIIDSVDNMIDKQKRNLLENLPSDEEDRRKLDVYNALKEDLGKVFEILS